VPVKNGFTIEGFTTLRLLEQDSQSSKTPLEELEEAILSKRRYEFTEWEPGNYLVFDTEHNEPFEIGIEGRDLAIYAKEATTSVTLREFCNLILEDFNSSYRLDKTSEKLRG
jgi:translation elongation factor P/translation initiation factor 5A